MLLTALLALAPGFRAEHTPPMVAPDPVHGIVNRVAHRALPQAAAASKASQTEALSSPIQAALDAADAALEALIAVPAEERTVANTLLAIDDATAQLTEDARMTAFLAEVSPDADVRATGREAQRDITNWYNRLTKNRAIFQALLELETLEPEMTAVERRYFEEALRDFRRAGFDLSDDKRARLEEIDEELSELGTEFRKNVAEDETLVFFTEDELRGLPQSYLGTLKRSGNLLQVTMQHPSLYYVLGYCEVDLSRQKFGAAVSMRGGIANVRVLEKLLKLRHERAVLLGYPNAAAYVLETRMARTPEAVMAFYDDLAPKVRKKAAADFAEFEAAKREHTGDPNAQLLATDVSFYKNRLKRDKYAVDTRSLREYLPVDVVTQGTFEICQELFGITFRDITESARDTRPFWHADVSLYEVKDSATGELLGEFYLDLFPREGKYRNASHFPIRQRKEWSDGRVSKPLVALVCNFTRPTDDVPSLMSHNEVTSFLHEFGHCLHSLLSESPIANFAGTRVARDFVEAPSQMLENWAWQPEILGRLARHYETGEPLPMDLIEGMIAAKNVGAGFNNEGQVYLGMMDMRFHMDDDGIVDTTKVCETSYSEARVFTATPNLYRQASFTHMIGYQAGYYGYLWSAVYAQDMWSRFADDPLNPDVAAEYRERVLAPGGSQDALDMVRSFLGREPNGDAFLRHLGLD